MCVGKNSCSIRISMYFVSDDPPPYIDGVKINSPHYLCKIILGPTSSRNYTVVVSQYEKSTTIYYTLRAYATCPFSLTKIVDPYKHEKQVCIYLVLIDVGKIIVEMGKFGRILIWEETIWLRYILKTMG